MTEPALIDQFPGARHGDGCSGHFRMFLKKVDHHFVEGRKTRIDLPGRGNGSLFSLGTVSGKEGCKKDDENEDAQANHNSTMLV